jgi:hypothetical protein
LLIASGLLALQVGGFYLLQRRGFSASLMRAPPAFRQARLVALMSQAEAIDRQCSCTYGRAGAGGGQLSC